MRFSPRLAAIFQALFVTFLWATSWVLIKIGLDDIPALTFAGLRYSLAFVCLLPFMRGRRAVLSRRDWVRLAALGLVFYTTTQGAIFLALAYLPAITTSLLLNFSPAAVALLAIVFLGERLTRWQWVGLVVSIVGALVYFGPAALPSGGGVGLLIVFIAVFANGIASVLGRQINGEGRIAPLVVTVTSMGVGGVVLLSVGILTQGMPQMSLRGWAIVGWLAVVNTAFAFTLWNHVLRTLTATESSVINNTIMVQIAVLAWLFLGEPLTGRAVLGLAIAAVGAVMVQVCRK